MSPSSSLISKRSPPFKLGEGRIWPRIVCACPVDAQRGASQGSSARSSAMELAPKTAFGNPRPDLIEGEADAAHRLLEARVLFTRYLVHVERALELDLNRVSAFRRPA